MGFPGYEGSLQGYGFMHDHLGNIKNEEPVNIIEAKKIAESHFQKDTNMTKNNGTEDTQSSLNGKVPEVFQVSDNELQLALISSYGLGLQTGNEKEHNRLFVVNMRHAGAFKALTAADVERYWFFDTQLPETLIFALADAAYYVPPRFCYKILNSFNMTKPIVQRVLDYALEQYPEKFTVVWGRDGSSLNTQFVYYTDFDNQPVYTKGNHPFDILADIRCDMISGHKALQQGINPALEVDEETLKLIEEEVMIATGVKVDAAGVITEIIFDPTDPAQTDIIEGLNDQLPGVFVG